MLHAPGFPRSHVESLRLLLLVDDEPGLPGASLVVEHGFSCWVETDSGRVLFDAGQGRAVVANAEQLAVRLEDADAVVLSHGHYDHTGGLALLPGQLPIRRVVAHPDFDTSHRGRSAGRDRDIGIPEAAALALLRTNVQRRREPSEVIPGVWATGEIPRVTDEGPGGAFFRDALGHDPDPIVDDQALLVRHITGLVLLLGCAHAGVVNSLRYARALFPGEPLIGVVGGMHLRHATSRRIERTAAELAAGSTGIVAPAHCTGDEARRRLMNRMPHRYCHVGVGSSLELDRNGDWRTS